MRLILNENGKAVAFIELNHVERFDVGEGKSEIFFSGAENKKRILVPVEAADFLMDCFLKNNELRVEGDCFNDWEYNYIKEKHI